MMDEFEALLSKFEDLGGKEPTPKEEAPKPAILVVDDDESMRRALTKMFSQKFDVTAVENGKRAIEESERRQFYTVVLDIKMPGMNGFEVCEVLAKKDADLPIIFYTAFQSEHDLQAILNIYRPFAYLDKGGNMTYRKPCIAPWTSTRAYFRGPYTRKSWRQKRLISTCRSRRPNQLIW